MSGYKFYTYFHTRNDSGEVFYVGKGTGERAFSKDRSNAHWQNIVSKYGHSVHIIAYWATEQEAFTHERELIIELRASGVKLVNQTDGGDGASGYTQSKEHTDAIRRANTGKQRSDATRQRIRESKIGSVVTPEHRAKISAAMKGRSPSPEHRAKLSAAAMGRTDTRKGAILTAETKAKMSASSTGKRHSEATRAAMSAARKGCKRKSNEVEA